MTGSSSFGRRHLLGAAGVGLLAGAGGGAGAVRAARGSPDTGHTSPVVPFRGAHQAGIATPVQDRLHFAAFDVTTTSRTDLADLLREWTRAAERMVAGRAVGAGAEPELAVSPPDDTGEAVGLPASRLTLTVGFGTTLFAKDGDDRFGLAKRRPDALRELPHFPGDDLDPDRSGGDIAVQACADDPQVAVHAIRNLARIGFGRVAVRWSQLGFGKTSSTTPQSQTPRNLFGFKDGTNNIAGDDAKALARHVWVGREGPAWLRGGSYLVARRIRMHIETWDRSALTEQEQIVGRSKGVGAPLDGTAERDPVRPADLPPAAHVALAHPSANGGARILRRGYSFVDGADGLGRLDAGLFFLAYDRDPPGQFVPLQARLARDDAMSEYLLHTGSGLYAVPPGVRDDGDYWGSSLFG
ncbi:MAG: deferrochelatase/peroxidase EfeB [Streptosporangiales bacterium]|nr:deferrochelatase/peroxidase EfeB [Streptosporangiales bacterium]